MFSFVYISFVCVLIRLHLIRLCSHSFTSHSFVFSFVYISFVCVLIRLHLIRLCSHSFTSHSFTFVCQWFKSYISNRQESVHIDGSLSCPQDLHFGVPQGSVLGRFLFCLYTTSISQIITTHTIRHHLYTDDTPVYIELSQSHKSISSDCLTDILLWMISSKLKLNSDKTELIIIGTKQQRHKLPNHFPVQLLDNDRAHMPI